MSGDFSGLGFRLLGYVVGGFVLLALLKGAAALVELLPVSRSRRETARRVAPLLGTVLVIGYCLFVVRSLFRQQPTVLPMALALVLGGFVAAAWGPLKDVVTGVFLKAGRVCSPGDTIQVGQVAGRVTEMGYRALCVETPSGEQVVVPYGQVAGSAIQRVPILAGAQAHVFELSLPEQGVASDQVLRIQRAALRHHWSSLVRMPEVKLVGPRLCRVTVYPLTSEHAPEIEEQVRRALG